MSLFETKCICIHKGSFCTTSRWTGDCYFHTVKSIVLKLRLCAVWIFVLTNLSLHFNSLLCINTSVISNLHRYLIHVLVNKVPISNPWSHCCSLSVVMKHDIPVWLYAERGSVLCQQRIQVPRILWFYL